MARGKKSVVKPPNTKLVVEKPPSSIIKFPEPPLDTTNDQNITTTDSVPADASEGMENEHEREHNNFSNELLGLQISSDQRQTSPIGNTASATFESDTPNSTISPLSASSASSPTSTASASSTSALYINHKNTQPLPSVQNILESSGAISTDDSLSQPLAQTTLSSSTTGSNQVSPIRDAVLQFDPFYLYAALSEGNIIESMMLAKKELANTPTNADENQALKNQPKQSATLTKQSLSFVPARSENTLQESRQSDILCESEKFKDSEHIREQANITKQGSTIATLTGSKSQNSVENVDSLSASPTLSTNTKQFDTCCRNCCNPSSTASLNAPTFDTNPTLSSNSNSSAETRSLAEKPVGRWSVDKSITNTSINVGLETPNQSCRVLHALGIGGDSRTAKEENMCDCDIKLTPSRPSTSLSSTLLRESENRTQQNCPQIENRKQKRIEFHQSLDSDTTKNIFTWDEIHKHNTPEDCWLVVDGVVYDVTDFLPEHPAGIIAIVKYGGTDATRHFDFHNKKAQSMWKKYIIGRTEDWKKPVCSIM